MPFARNESLSEGCLKREAEDVSCCEIPSSVRSSIERCLICCEELFHCPYGLSGSGLGLKSVTGAEKEKINT